jgi:hypothetical protein
MAPIPKPPELRQRRNKVSTRAFLATEAEAAEGAQIPPLPEFGKKSKWHPMVVEWWESVWKSPMAAEYLESDKKDLCILARLHQDFWTAKTRKERQSAATEIRQQGVRFGLSPIDRRRLQWEVEKGEQASQQTETRRRTKDTPRRDPREVLKVV